MRIFHIATAADWAEARRTGAYTTSTRGRTLAEEGFIHASRGDQWQGVRDRFYADVTEPLVLLVVDTERLTSPVVEEAVPDSDETFPHVYGPINPDAVVQTLPVRPTSPSDPGGPSGPRGTSTPDKTFTQVFLGEVIHRVLLGSLVVGLGFAGVLVGLALHTRWTPLAGALAGLALGSGLARVVHVRRRERERAAAGLSAV